MCSWMRAGSAPAASPGWTPVSGPSLAVSDSSPGLNLLAGAKFFLTERVAVFCEGRYTYASFQFEDAGLVGAGVKGVYQAPGVVAGMAWHFK